MRDKKIFIIEDDVNLLYGLEAQFNNAGFHVEINEADNDDDEILKHLRKFKPDYIVLDLILPKVEGFELLQRIKADDELGEKEVFIFTDLSDEDSRERSLEMGADYVFFKEDFDTFSFAEKVIKIIKNKNKGELEPNDDEGEFDLVID
ncbi:MAG: response regulator [Patescibacteria group bacterium]|jgi:DNA-binding response OmpR family regulator|nr:response regulator [Patescibacteria group bacterium]MDD3778032.1 response regulator [Patescibacteria group bacterium]MDD3939431.1 response regulator [Patescibacteria group bacterium]MDD4443880.1 response regulator [Patescibacteria group bacterium]NCU39636.1 response regulator transcription factor [Candidatus Falkowbacteria bacterium]